MNRPIDVWLVFRGDFGNLFSMNGILQDTFNILHGVFPTMFKGAEGDLCCMIGRVTKRRNGMRLAGFEQPSAMSL